MLLSNTENNTTFGNNDMTEHNNNNDVIYKFRGKKFPCDAQTIQILNLALSMNGVEDRYEKILDI